MNEKINTVTASEELVALLVNKFDSVHFEFGQDAFYLESKSMSNDELAKTMMFVAKLTEDDKAVDYSIDVYRMLPPYNKRRGLRVVLLPADNEPTPFMKQWLEDPFNSINLDHIDINEHDIIRDQIC